MRSSHGQSADLKTSARNVEKKRHNHSSMAPYLDNNIQSGDQEGLSIRILLCHRLMRRNVHVA